MKKSILPIALVLLIGVTTASAFIDPQLAGTTQYEGWDDMTVSRLGTSRGTFPSPPFYEGAVDWPEAIDPNKAGSANLAEFDKVSGNGYNASSSVYSPFGPSTYKIVNGSALSGLQTLVFQIDSNGSTFGASPVLNYNSGSQSVAFDFSGLTAGEFTSSGAPGSSPTPTTNNIFQWDLSGISETINSYEIVWTTTSSAAIYGMELNSSDSFSGSAVPEPGTYALISGIFMMSYILYRRRK